MNAFVKYVCTQSHEVWVDETWALSRSAMVDYKNNPTGDKFKEINTLTPALEYI